MPGGFPIAGGMFAVSAPTNVAPATTSTFIEFDPVGRANRVLSNRDAAPIGSETIGRRCSFERVREFGVSRTRSTEDHDRRCTAQHRISYLRHH